MSASLSSSSDNNTNDNNTTIEINPEALFGQIDPSKIQEGGYNIFSKPFISQKSVELLRHRMERVFEGEYSTGQNPTKTPAQLSTKKNKNKINNDNNNNSNTKSVIHMINISKADKHFKQLALHPLIGEAVAKVMNWPSVKFAQDQVWCKPPGSSALSFHRDSPYFDMTPQDVATLWITFDDLTSSSSSASSSSSSSGSPSSVYSQLGPLEYCHGSHLWGRKDNDGDRSVGARTGTASQFFDPDYYAMLRSAAQCEGIEMTTTTTDQKQNDEHSNNADENNNNKSTTKNNKTYQPPPNLKIEVVEALPGGGSIHNGRTYHGSGPNRSETQPRRGIGIHYVRGDAKFKRRKIVEKVVVNEETGETKEVEKEVLKLGKLWEPLKAPDGSDDLCEEFFPTIYPQANNPMMTSLSKRREREEEEEAK